MCKKKGIDRDEDLTGLTLRLGPSESRGTRARVRERSTSRCRIVLWERRRERKGRVSETDGRWSERRRGVKTKVFTWKKPKMYKPMYIYIYYIIYGIYVIY